MKSTFKIVKEHGYRIIIDGHDTFAEDVVRKLERLDYLEKERLKLSDNSDYATALYEIIDRYLYNAGAKAPTIDACIAEIQRLNQQVDFS